MGACRCHSYQHDMPQSVFKVYLGPRRQSAGAEGLGPRFSYGLRWNR